MSKENLVAELLRSNALCTSTLSENEALNASNIALKAEKERLEFRELDLLQRIADLSRKQFGSSSERFVPLDPNQLQLDFGQVMEEAKKAAQTETVTYERKKKSRKETPVRTHLPEHLPRVVFVIEPDFDTTGMTYIGDVVTEVLDLKPGYYFVKQTRRPKYIIHTSDEGTKIACAALPSRPIWKGIAGPGLLAWIITEKFLWHVPFHRQWQRFSSHGITIPTSTMGGWFSRSCHQLLPLYELLKTMLLASGYVQADETHIKVLDKSKKGKSHMGWFWVYHAPILRIIIMDYQKFRSKAGPLRMLANYLGWLQVDGYAVYDDYEKRVGVFLVGCLAHARRYFDKALKNDKTRSEWMLAKIKELYAIERDARQRKLNHDQRKELRIEKTMPIFGEIHAWLIENLQQVPPQSAIAKAIKYFMGRFEYIQRVCADGQLEIDNNLVENAIRPVAVGRNNYMFAGSHDAAQNMAMIYSLLRTAKANGLEPYEWLRNTLEVIDGYPKDKLHELLPIKTQE